MPDRLDVWMECLNPKVRPLPGMSGWQVLTHVRDHKWVFVEPAKFPAAPYLRFVGYLRITAMGMRPYMFMFKRNVRIEPNTPASIKMEDPILMVPERVG